MIKRKISSELAYLKSKIRRNKEQCVLILIWILFVIVCSTLAFIFSKEDPIPLTEDEIEYYTAQAELAYYEGIIYLDDDITVKNNHDGSFDVYDYKQPEQKQKLTVTFLEGGKIDIYPYYSYDFHYHRISETVMYGLMSIVLFLPLAFAVLWIISAICEFICFIYTKFSKNLPESEEDASTESADKYGKK